MATSPPRGNAGANGAAAPSVRAIIETSGAPARKTGKDKIRGIIGAGEVYRFYGKPGTGKSLMLAPAAYHIAVEEPWHGREIAQTLVFYISPGGDPAEMFEALKDHHGIEITAATPLRSWSGPINKPAAVLAAIRMHETALGRQCGLAVLDADHGVMDWPAVEELTGVLIDEIGASVVVTTPDDRALDLHFDGYWHAPAPVEDDLCVLQVQSMRRKGTRGMMTFKLVVENGRTAAVATSQRPTLMEMRGPLRVVWDAVVLRCGMNNDWTISPEEFRSAALASGIDALANLSTTGLRNRQIRNWWGQLLEKAALYWDAGIGRARVHSSWRYSRLHRDIGCIAEAAAASEQRRQARKTAETRQQPPGARRGSAGRKHAAFV
jgi:AAA domain